MSQTTLVLEQEADGIRAAFLENGTVVSFYFQPNSDDARVGDIYIGRVLKNRFEQIGCFIDLGGGRSGFLPHSKCGNRPPVAGERLLVQVTKERREAKVPELTDQVQIKGRLLIYLPLNHYVTVSRRISSDQCERLKKTVMEWCTSGDGAIVRTQAEGCSYNSLHEEFDVLRKKWLSILSHSDNHQGKTRIFRQFSFAMALLNENRFPSNCTVIANFPVRKEDLPPNTEFIYQPEEELFLKRKIEMEYKNALKPFVPITDGASLMIEYTDALTAIDVNSGSAAFARDREHTALEINCHAAREIAKQLRLRQIGGLIVIDFLRMEKEQSRTRLLQELKRAVSPDPCSVRVYGFTRIGLVELTRTRVRSGLRTYAQLKGKV
ncbi:ribonuclease E/G [Sporolactobacillus sp. CPB3-1]|uniref:Ribonuclease E/G n=1 Tax=Sporolactobacillus mangiferae TaxID=2940498 RepID=A0ABT0M6L4_9BACL|nr:ribonuclease E/G [Sporolactobacillus mangiferae]